MHNAVRAALVESTKKPVSDYLQNYLAWFRACNQEPNNAKSWLSGGVKMLANT